MKNNIPSKAIVIGMIMQVAVGNINAGWKEGLVTVIKKVERPDGYFHPYVSGQALRRYIRDTMKDILKDRNDENLKMSPEEKSSDKKAPIVTLGDPRKYIDDDLFGFMRAIKKERGKKSEKNKESTDEGNEGSELGATRRRTSPLRVSPAYGMFKLNADRDLGTRSALEFKQSAEAGGSFFETEITNNLFRSTLLLELDRVGVWKGYETTSEKDKDGGELDENTRKTRMTILLESIKYLWGGGRQARLLVDLTPQFIIYARMRRKVPIFLNSIDVEYSDGNFKIKTDIIRETVKDYAADIQSLIVGIRTGRFTNSNEEFKELHDNVQVTTVGGAIDLMIEDIKAAKLA
ncbi:MAG: type I-B CRISPR-associated protein Cas7/Cst2/DevR [Thermoplasmatales archaeon]